MAVCRRGLPQSISSVRRILKVRFYSLGEFRSVFSGCCRASVLQKPKTVQIQKLDSSEAFLS